MRTLVHAAALVVLSLLAPARGVADVPGPARAAPSSSAAETADGPRLRPDTCSLLNPRRAELCRRGAIQVKRGARVQIVGGVLLSGTYSLLAVFVAALNGICGIGAAEEGGGSGCADGGSMRRALGIGGGIVGLGSVGLFIHGGRRLHLVHRAEASSAMLRPWLSPIVAGFESPPEHALGLVGFELSLVGRFR